MGTSFGPFGWCWALLLAAGAWGCGPDYRDPPQLEGMHGCVDRDGDGFGAGCELGADCDDADPELNDECPEAAPVADEPAGGGAQCEEGARRECTFDVDAGPGPPLCTPGERRCEDGMWGPCEPIPGEWWPEQ